MLVLNRTHNAMEEVKVIRRVAVTFPWQQQIVMSEMSHLSKHSYAKLHVPSGTLQMYHFLPGVESVISSPTVNSAAKAKKATSAMMWTVE
ncbi:hypothetical protein V6N13_036363 [Hibiscus sabdariffa]|uniref:Uncharacterized protein n=1 Tax=Hibiscus sabdariffa TaxID=183260 RepID=A0ABR2S7H7_9ROSI